MLIADTTTEDWPRIWPFFHQIVQAGETFTYDLDLNEQAGRETWVLGPPGRTVVAVDPAGDVVGSAHMGPNRGGPGAHVATASFMVDERHAGRGVGRALASDAITWARAQGYRAMQFNAVAETNTHAVRLYQSLGFAIIGTVPDGFAHPRHGYVGLHVMHRPL